MADQRDYRLVLILPESREILVEQEEGLTKLPRVSVIAGERSVEQLNRVVAERWEISSVVLDVALCGPAGTPWAFMEVRGRIFGSNAEELRPTELDALPAGVMPAEVALRLSILWSCESSSDRLFTRFGWLDMVQQWIRDSVPDRQVSFNGNIRQLNAGGGFELCRLGVRDGPAYWVKAVAPPNTHEFQITQRLANCVPGYLPNIVAMRKDWNAWVMEDAGFPLEEDFTLPRVRQAVQTLADLQLDSLSYIATLRKAGCSDCTLAELEAHLSEIREYLQEAMARQTSSKVEPLDRGRLLELEAILRECCFRMQELNIPDTLIHNDINPGNVLFCGTRCCFIDWAEAQIGNPFLTFQHVCAQITCKVSDAATWLSVVMNLYRAQWREWLSDSQIDQAYSLMPILAIASYLYGRGTWLSSPDRDNPQFQAYARSLARYIDRAARVPGLEETLCQ